MSRTSAPSYRLLAAHYDELFAAARSPLDAARRDLLRPILPRVRTACDLGCGTGITALSLARDGVKVYAVDVSPAMCRIARAKAAHAARPVRVLCADMRSFRLPEAVDLITCEGDALNHVPRRQDLRAVAASVARALRPGGWFFCDVNNAAGFERYWSGTRWFEKPGWVLVMRNGHDRRASHAWSDIEWFVREGRFWRRGHDRVEEVCWTPAEVRSTLAHAGFDRIRAVDAAPYFKHEPMIGPGCRSFYLARKSP